MTDNTQIVPQLLDHDVEVLLNSRSLSTNLTRTLTNLAIVWLPLIPFYLFYRNAISGRSGERYVTLVKKTLIYYTVNNGLQSKELIYLFVYF